MTGFDDVLWGPEQLRDRLARAATAASAAGVDALIVTPGTDLRYLTGYDAPALERLTCLILSADGSPVMLVPGLEVAAAKASPVGDADIEVVGWAETTDPFALAASVLGEPGVIAVNDQMWARAALALMTAVPDARMIAAGGVLSGLRMIKSPAEVAALRHAGALIDDVHACVGDWLRPGRTENEVARDIADAIA
ncbi:MAG: aminopeptidase P family N-terminal domain-containing protein, partial [Actinomycetes bacterium]